jgi:SdrD B-like domain
MMVRRLCVTPAVESLMQWLLTRRKRTTSVSTGKGYINSAATQLTFPKEHEMSQEPGQNRLKEHTQQLLQGPLKHARAAALAAALLPLASVLATPAGAQTTCPSGGICGTVFSDTNGDGVQNSGEPGIGGASVTLVFPDGHSTTVATSSCPDPLDLLCLAGQYAFSAPITDGNGIPVFGNFQVVVQIPPNTQPTNGTTDNNGNVFVPVDYEGIDTVRNFGFSATTGFPNPGTGTPGYWKTHPEAWPVSSITVGGVPYTVAQAIYLISLPDSKDKALTMFGSLVSAMLNVNVKIGNDPTCVSETIDAANGWMATYGPPNNPDKKKWVAASSYAWKVGEPMHRQMDNYNNGMLCAPHRD